jgi:hypothetical protein
MTRDMLTSTRKRKFGAIRAGSDARRLGSQPVRPARSTSELWQAHARQSFEAACRSAPGELDAVRVFRARRIHAPRDFIRPLGLAVALSHANAPVRTPQGRPDRA